mgnify:CR=1 FL=1
MKTLSKLFILLVAVFTALVFVMIFANSVNATNFFTFNSAWEIRDFVNSFPQYTNIPNTEPGSGALRSDEVTATKICQLKGYKVSKILSADYYRSCENNTIGYWESSVNDFKIINACQNNRYIKSLQCSEPLVIVCATKTNCGTDGYTGGAFCIGNNVYQNYKTYTCNNPGTTYSSCSNSTAPQLKLNCSGNQTCSNGQCQNINIACSTNANCGTNGYAGSPYCQNNNIYQNYTIYTCNNAGATNSYCSNSTENRLKSDCAYNQTCNNGQCSYQNIAQNIVCNSNYNCGTNGYAGGAFCMGNSVYENYITYTCNNPGTTYSSCNSSTTAQLQNTCGTNQTCANGYCSKQQNYITVQTISATNTYNNQATLNGYFSGTNINNINYVWFQWGTTTSYGYNGYETNHQTTSYTGPFNQNIAELSPGIVYYFRAVAQNYNGQIVYGQDMTFQLGQVLGAQVLGATDVSTGLTNNFLADSFFLPLIIALAGIWLFKSGILGLDGWVNSRRIKHRDYVAGKKLKTKIAEIKEREKLN